MSEELRQKVEAPEITQTVKAAVAPRPVRRYRAWVFHGYVVVAVVAFAILAFYAHSAAYFGIDLTLTLAVQSIHFYLFDVLMRFLSVLGFAPQVTLLWALITLLLYVMGLKWESFMAFFSAVGVSALGHLFKIIVNRQRPSDDLVHVIERLNDSSFPSGHVLFYVGFIGFLWFLCYTLLKPSWRRTLALYVFGGSVALAGLSRVYLGQHWPSDVIGAYLLGSVWLAITIYLYRWGKPRFFVHQPQRVHPKSIFQS